MKYQLARHKFLNIILSTSMSAANKPKCLLLDSNPQTQVLLSNAKTTGAKNRFPNTVMSEVVHVLKLTVAGACFRNNYSVSDVQEEIFLCCY